MSKRLHLNIPHTVGRAEAIARAHALGEYFENRHGMKMSWRAANIGHLEGNYLLIHIDGLFEIDDREVRLDGKDPGFLLRGKALEYLERKIRAYMDPATPLEQLQRA
ncbi:MAG: polyhydroxyalkanoic acid system family protein [Deltaproteobacteria bacterium]|nr:polyhydroxyalkanoic acid system family protein [Deltaproteobacteria bacterium]